MRYLLSLTAAAFAACGLRESAQRAERADTATTPTVAETTKAAAPAPAPTGAPDSAFAARLVGTWSAKGYDSGSTRAQRFTLTWERGPDGSLTGKVAFQPGETYNVTVVSTSDSTVTYESAPHRSPTLKTEVVTRTEAHLSGDSITGTYEARAQEGGKTLRGKFAGKRTTAR